ncbi:MAG: Flagellin [Bacteroidota bacterium]|nr:Flagellin [Bacteroidota bacterium]
MPVVNGDNARIRTNISAQNAYNSLFIANRDISLRQLRLSTGKRINNASDDVAGYITSRALQARNGTLRSSILAVGDAQNITNIVQDALSNLNDLVTQIKDSASTASSGALGTDEKVALAKAAFRLVQQIQTVVDSTVFGGQQLLDGTYSEDFVIGSNSQYQTLNLSLDMSTSNADFNVASNNFNVNSMTTGIFAGVSNLNLNDFNSVSASNLGIFSDSSIATTIYSLAEALNNVNKVASQVGGIAVRLNSQESLLKEQIINYNAAISRLEDADVAKEQLDLIKSQFLQQASLTSLAQANQNPTGFLQLIRG